MCQPGVGGAGSPQVHFSELGQLIEPIQWEPPIVEQIHVIDFAEKVFAEQISQPSGSRRFPIGESW